MITDSGEFAYVNPPPPMFAGAFAQDVNSTEAEIMAVVQKPINISIFGQKSGPPAWKQLPTWYQVSEMTTFSISQRGLKKKALILFGYSNAFCGLSSPRHHMEEHLIVIFQFNIKLHLCLIIDTIFVHTFL
ncbi:MAG: hypothetical protein WA364_09465, partial [Candidatus Nitrosopolaris sp.]